MEPVKSSSEGFPSDMLPMKKKDKAWHLQYSKAFQGQHQRVIDSVTFTKWKKLSEGKQEEAFYKNILGSRKRAGKESVAWRNLDYTILPIMPKFVKIIKNKILEQPKDFNIRAIDPWSVDQVRQRKNQIVSHMLTEELNKTLQELGIAVQSPFEPGEATPSNVNEIDLYLDAYPKNQYVSRLYDELDLCFAANKWKTIEREIIESLVKVGVFGTWCYLDPKGYIRIKPMKVERVITNPVEKNDFSDMTRIGEYIPMSINEIRKLANKEIDKGEITEKDLAAIATKSSGISYSPMSRDMLYNSARLLGTYSQAYDHQKVMVLRWQAKSTDSLAYVISEEDGKITIDPRDNPYWLDASGLSDKQYEEDQKAKGLNKSVYRLELENIYEACWIVGTEHVFAYGLKSNIQRNANSMAEAEFDAKIYTLDFDSIARQLEPVLHSAQLNWLQFQHHTAMSIPDGAAINKRALTEIQIGGKGGVTLDALDLVDQYVQTGTFVYTDMTKDGRQIPMPFTQIKGGTNEKAMHHFNMVLQNIEMAKIILGLNDVTDASSPNPYLGKGVSQLAVQSSNTALGDFFYGYNYIYEETARSVARLVPDSKMRKPAGNITAMGMQSQKYWEANSDANYIDFSITVDVGWDQEKRDFMKQAVQESLKISGGVLLPQDGYVVVTEKNPEKAYLLLESKTKQRTREIQEFELQKIKENAQQQQQSNIASEQMKQQTLKMTMAYEQAKNQAELERITHEMQWKLILAKTEKGMELQDNERERLNQLMISHDKNMTSIKTTEISANSKHEKEEMSENRK